MNPKTSSDLFNKIRSQFANITIGNKMGEATADPNEAVFFDFEFKEDADTFGRISVSLADDESMKVFYNRNLVDKIDEDSRDEWYAFLKELKDFAVEHQLGFDVRDITKNNLTKQDYKNIADTNKTVNTDDMSEELNRLTSLAGIKEVSDMGMNKYGLAAKHEKGKFYSYRHGKLTGTFDSMEELQKHQAELIKNESVNEGLSGTSKSSFENLDKTRLIIRHTGKVDETVPGARSRQIQSLYIENEDGERFKYPLTHLAGARAMTRHVANGGRPHDEFGQHIVSTSEDIAKLNSFSRYVSNKDQLNDNAGDVIEQTKLKLENLRSYMKNLSKQGHYETASKDFKTADEVVLDDETANSYKEKFTMKNLDSRVEEALPLIHKIMSEYKPDDKPKDIGEPIDAPEEPQVDHGAVVQSYLTDPESRLVLRKDDTADKMLSVTKFNDKNTLLGSVLSDIASRMLTKTNVEDRVANFASRIADLVSQEGEPFFKPDADYPKNKKIAIQLARRYIDDYNKMKKDPAYADQVRMDPAKFNPKKDLKGKAKETEAFENWVNNIDKIEEDKGSTLASRMIRKAGEEDKDSMDSDLYIKAAKMLDAEQLEDLGILLYASDTAPREFIMKTIADHDPDTFKKMYGDQEGYLSTMKPLGMKEYAKEPKDQEDKDAKLKALQDIQMDPNTAKDPEVADKMQQRKKELMQKAFPEGTTFEDIKPYVSMYKDKDGKMVNDVLDKDGNSVYKSHSGKEAMAYLSKNYDKLRGPKPTLGDFMKKEQEEASEINSELDRIKTLANLS